MSVYVVVQSKFNDCAAYNRYQAKFMGVLRQHS